MLSTVWSLGAYLLLNVRLSLDRCLRLRLVGGRHHDGPAWALAEMDCHGRNHSAVGPRESSSLEPLVERATEDRVAGRPSPAATRRSPRRAAASGDGGLIDATLRVGVPRWRIRCARGAGGCLLARRPQPSIARCGLNCHSLGHPGLLNDGYDLSDKSQHSNDDQRRGIHDSPSMGCRHGDLNTRWAVKSAPRKAGVVRSSWRGSLRLEKFLHAWRSFVRCPSLFLTCRRQAYAKDEESKS